MNPARLEVLKNLVTSIAEEIRYVIKRASSNFPNIIKLKSYAIFDWKGRLIA